MKLTKKTTEDIIASLFERGMKELIIKKYKDDDGVYFEIIDSEYESFSEEAFNTNEGVNEWIEEFLSVSLEDINCFILQH